MSVSVVMVPMGWKDVHIGIDTLATVTLPNQTIIGPGRHFDINDNTTNLGDPLLNALIGWHEGKWHWNMSALLNVPIGPWDRDSITNISFNHWALDTSTSVTYLDAAKGHEVSVTAGFTYNWENPDTDYKTGTEFHVEWGLIQHVSKTFTLGLAGYHYQQVSGDSGAGASLGDFEGRVTALGPVMTYAFECGKIPVSTEWKYMHEFDVKNRARGRHGNVDGEHAAVRSRPLKPLFCKCDQEAQPAASAGPVAARLRLLGTASAAGEGCTQCP